jgi:hypothetical protein
MRALNYFFKAVFTFSVVFFMWFLQHYWLTLYSDQIGLVFGMLFISVYGLFLLFSFDYRDDSAEE